MNPVTLPTTAADFANPAAIGTVTSKSTTADTNVAASRLGKLNLGTVTTANNGTAFGVAGDQVAVADGDHRHHPGQLQEARDPGGRDRHRPTGLTLGDFAINVV